MSPDDLREQANQKREEIENISYDADKLDELADQKEAEIEKAQADMEEASDEYE